MKAIVLTTINIPKNIPEFMEKADEDWVPVVVGDLKTPHDKVKEICDTAHGIYLSPDIQKTLGFSHTGAIPWNCYDRKNIGYLFALREGAEVIFSTDDDNYPSDHWDSYAHLGKQQCKVVSSPTGWWNCCTLGDVDIAPRGYPYWLINEKPEYTFLEKEVDIAVQAGLWLGDPDIDAMTRLVKNPTVASYTDEDIALDTDTMCPYNTQNTFITREMMPANMLWSCARTSVYRYDDIFAGYAGQVIAKYHGKTVKFGRPHLFQERNYHDIIKDMYSEIGGMECQPEIFSIFNTLQFRSQQISDNLKELVYTAVDKVSVLPESLKKQVDSWCNDLSEIGLE